MDIDGAAKRPIGITCQSAHRGRMYAQRGGGTLGSRERPGDIASNSQGREYLQAAHLSDPGEHISHQQQAQPIGWQRAFSR